MFFCEVWLVAKTAVNIRYKNKCEYFVLGITMHANMKSSMLVGIYSINSYKII